MRQQVAQRDRPPTCLCEGQVASYPVVKPKLKKKESEAAGGLMIRREQNQRADRGVGARGCTPPLRRLPGRRFAGRLVFVADLVRALYRADRNPGIEFMRLSSYGSARESSGLV